MRKPKLPRTAERTIAPPAAGRSWQPWWMWMVALAGLLVVFAVYAPSFGGPCLLDDRYLPFCAPQINDSLVGFVHGLRPILMFSYWINYQFSGANLYTYHVANVIFHFLVSVLVTLMVARLLEWAEVSGRKRILLAMFSGALFLLHPLQTESVAYVASRSENLSVLFYYAAFTVFLYRRTDSMRIGRAAIIVVLFGAAAATKEHTLTLPVLLLLTDFFWHRGGLRKNATLYALLAIVGLIGAVCVWRILGASHSAGFNIAGLTPASYLFTEGRVNWIYVRMFLLPFGQNLDPDIPISPGLLDHGAIWGLGALAAVGVAAWIYRKRYPLAAFGVLVFLLLSAPTSSFIPINDVMAEHRLYLPFLGLILIGLEFLRRMNTSLLSWTVAFVLAACVILTYQRNQVWANPITLWQDSVAKSPHKFRPRFQLAFAQFEDNQCATASQSYQEASLLAPVDHHLLLNWALALDCAGQPDEAIAKLRQAVLSAPTAHMYSQLGMVTAKNGHLEEAQRALAQAEKIDPNYDLTYFYLGNIHALRGERAAAAREYEHCLRLNPANQTARDMLSRLGN